MDFLFFFYFKSRSQGGATTALKFRKNCLSFRGISIFPAVLFVLKKMVMSNLQERTSSSNPQTVGKIITYTECTVRFFFIFFFTSSCQRYKSQLFCFCKLKYRLCTGQLALFLLAKCSMLLPKKLWTLSWLQFVFELIRKNSVFTGLQEKIYIFY